MISSFSKQLHKISSKIGLDGFVIALLGMILLAYIWPTPGIQSGIFSLKEIANYGVSLIFFFYGLRLSPAKLREGISNWRLHLVVQIATFILFPLIILVVGKFIPIEGREMLWLGVFFVAALPSTVSSSVVMVSLAKGNIPGAIFNASISALIGVFITPLWMGLFINTNHGNIELSGVIFKLILQVILPVGLGILLHSKLGSFAERHKKSLRKSDQVTILLIVYTAFCESFAMKMFDGFSLFELSILCIGMVALFSLMAGMLTLISHLLRFSREDSITALFCGSKKSLVHGTVMSKVLFPHSTAAGIILLPLMIYHAFQLIAASVIAKRFGNNHLD